MRYACYSGAGRVKLVNEDAILLRVASRGSKLRGMMAVCDGVSSLTQSAYASRFVIKCLNELFEKWKQQQIQPLQELTAIHKALYAQGKKDHNAYGTTCSLFLFEEDHYQLLQVGDSRIYLLQDDLTLLTVDQTLARMKYDQQTISLAEYCHSCERHVLTQCLGIHMPIQIEQRKGTWHQRDCVLLCSDGISNLVTEEVLRKYMKRLLYTSHHDSAKMLAEAAMIAGESDNLSAVMFSRYGEK